MEARKRRTVYEHKGYKLRSYTELMWARLMDAVDIFYLYEPHLLQIEGGFYLPDFYLPSSDIYLEVKGEEPSADEYRKAAEATRATGRPVIFLIARPQSDRGGFMNCYLNLPMGSSRGPFSLHDLDQVYLEVAGPTAWTQALLSVREDDMDWIRSAGEVMDEVLMQLSGRSGMESHLRLTHKRVNETRLQETRSESIAEQGIAWWRNRYHPKPDQSQQPVPTPSARGAQ